MTATNGRPSFSEEKILAIIEGMRQDGDPLATELIKNEMVRKTAIRLLEQEERKAADFLKRLEEKLEASPTPVALPTPAPMPKAEPAKEAEVIQIADHQKPTERDLGAWKRQFEDDCGAALPPLLFENWELTAATRFHLVQRLQEVVELRDAAEGDYRAALTGFYERLSKLVNLGINKILKDVHGKAPKQARADALVLDRASAEMERNELAWVFTLPENPAEKAAREAGIAAEMSAMQERRAKEEEASRERATKAVEAEREREKRRREKLAPITALLAAVDYFQSLGENALVNIASQIERKFSGSPQEMLEKKAIGLLEFAANERARVRGNDGVADRTEKEAGAFALAAGADLEDLKARYAAKRAAMEEKNAAHQESSFSNTPAGVIRSRKEEEALAAAHRAAKKKNGGNKK